MALFNKKSQEPEVTSAALVGAMVVGVVAIEATRSGVRWLGRKAHTLLSKPLAEVTFEPNEVEVDGNRAEA